MIGISCKEECKVTKSAPGSIGICCKEGVGPNCHTVFTPGSGSDPC